MDNNLNTSPEQAHEQLAAAGQHPLTSPRDRSLHAWSTALFGVALGGVMVAMHHLEGTARVIVSIASWALLLFALTWVERRANVTPLGAGRWSRIGFGTSFILSLLLVLPWLNMRAQDGPVAWPLLLAAAFVVAVPCLLAAARIATDRR